MGKLRQVNRHQNVNGTRQGVRPLFKDAIKYSSEIYNPNWDIETLLKMVAEKIGGMVAANINSGDFKNTCAIRMSYILNRGGLKIKYVQDQTVSGFINEKKFWFYYRVKDLINFLTNEWGKPDIKIDRPTEKDVEGKKGIIIFETDFSDATGHATLIKGAQLIDGTRTAASCYDHCYFCSQGYKTSKAHFWELR